eukprot:4255073-Amphidinium_carterae.1
MRPTLGSSYQGLGANPQGIVRRCVQSVRYLLTQSSLPPALLDGFLLEVVLGTVIAWLPIGSITGGTYYALIWRIYYPVVALLLPALAELGGLCRPSGW